MSVPKQRLEIPNEAEAGDLKKVLEKLVENGGARVEVVNQLLVEQIREQTEKRAKEISLKHNRELSPEKISKLLSLLRRRFENPKNMRNRHPGLEWAKVMYRFETRPEKIWSLYEMERTCGEPDVTGFDELTGEFIFDECSLDVPLGVKIKNSYSRRNIAYDCEAEALCRNNYPHEKCNGNAVEIAAAMGVDIIDEEGYRRLVEMGKFDKGGVFSWIKTPLEKRMSGLALSGVHVRKGALINGDDPSVPLGNRGFRGTLRV